MSIWTHVNASIRIDGGPIFPGLKNQINKIISNLPSGSEGTLEYQLWKTNDRHALASHTLNIFGDLRDFDDDESLEKWIENLCKEILLIRSAIFEIDNESKTFLTVFCLLKNGPPKIVKKTFLKPTD